MVDLRPGQTFVPGATAKTARRLLDAAAKAGLDPKTAVRTTEGGFIVPEAVVPGEPAKSPAKPKAAPKKGKTARILPVDPPPEPTSATASRGRRKKSTTKEGD
jgi:hypothetical protein